MKFKLAVALLSCLVVASKCMSIEIEDRSHHDHHSSSSSSSSSNESIDKVKAEVILVPANASGVTGKITFKQDDDHRRVLVEGKVFGLAPGLHGFHVHAIGDVGNNCTNNLGHFNPFNVTHGSPWAKIHHVGDFGNVYAGPNGEAKIKFTDSSISLQDGVINSIMGRGVSIHIGQDDFGLGGAPTSNTTGNSGPRVACGVVVKVHHDHSHSHSHGDSHSHSHGHSHGHSHSDDHSHNHS